MTEEVTPTPAGETPAGEEVQQQEQMIPQAEVDRIVRERVARERAKFADYEDLKSRAEGAKTVEQQLAELQQKHAEAEARALRSDIAVRHGISPEDRDLFLTGTDEDTLTAQAKRLVERDVDRKKQGNVAPREGVTTTTGNVEAETLALARQLFGGSA